MFTGELNVLSGQHVLVNIRATEAGELVEIEREALRTLVQTDSQLSDIFLRPFILRRLELIAHDIGDIVLIGSNHSFECFRKCANGLRRTVLCNKTGNAWLRSAVRQNCRSNYRAFRSQCQYKSNEGDSVSPPAIQSDLGSFLAKP
jgi:hypothetical protein